MAAQCTRRAVPTGGAHLLGMGPGNVLTGTEAVQRPSSAGKKSNNRTVNSTISNSKGPVWDPFLFSVQHPDEKSPICFILGGKKGEYQKHKAPRQSQARGGGHHFGEGLQIQSFFNLFQWSPSDSQEVRIGLKHPITSSHPLSEPPLPPPCCEDYSATGLRAREGNRGLQRNLCPLLSGS